MNRHRKLVVFVGLAYAVSWLAWAPLWLEKLGALDIQPSPYWHLTGSSVR